MTETRVVIDTGVVLSAALFPGSTPRLLVDKVVAGGTLLVSVETLTELAAVFLRDKFDRYVPKRARLEFLGAFSNQAQLVEIRSQTGACRDPKDNIILDVAVNGHATHLVTGDKDLLVLNPFQGITILNPAEFLAQTGMG